MTRKAKVLQAVLLFLAMMLVLVDTRAEEPIPHPWDYLSHAVGGAIVVEIVEPETIPQAFFLTLGVGYVKEGFDRNVDHVDALAWAVGGVLYHRYKVAVSRRNDAVLLTKSFDF